MEYYSKNTIDFSRKVFQQAKMDVLQDMLGFLCNFHPEQDCIQTDKTFRYDESVQIYSKLLIYTKNHICIYIRTVDQ